MVHKQKFIEFVEDQWEWEKEQSEAVWFKENDGSFPEEYLGEDLMNDIINKFYAPYYYITDLIEKEYRLPIPTFRIIVMPSYEDSSYVVVHDGEKVYLTDSTKAWNFWWQDEKDFDEWVDEQLNEIRSRLNPNLEKVS